MLPIANSRQQALIDFKEICGITKNFFSNAVKTTQPPSQPFQCDSPYSPRSPLCGAAKEAMLNPERDESKARRKQSCHAKTHFYQSILTQQLFGVSSVFKNWFWLCLCPNRLSSQKPRKKRKLFIFRLPLKPLELQNYFPQSVYKKLS